MCFPRLNPASIHGARTVRAIADRGQMVSREKHWWPRGNVPRHRSKFGLRTAFQLCERNVNTPSVEYATKSGIKTG